MNLWDSIIMKLALDKNLQQVHIFGDSLLIIKWNNNEKIIHDIAVHAIAGQLKGISQTSTRHKNYICTCVQGIELTGGFTLKRRLTYGCMGYDTGGIGGWGNS